MRRIHFICGEKSGVGKSVMARLLAQYYLDRAIPFKAYDADRSDGSLLRHYSGYCEVEDISQFGDACRILEQAQRSGSTAILDISAQASQSLNRWIDESRLFDSAIGLGLSLTFWHLMDESPDSLLRLKRLFANYGEKPDYVVVRNYGCGIDFSSLEESEICLVLQHYGARVIDLHALHRPTMRKIDHINASFWDAANNTNSELGPTLGLLERQRVRTWLNRTYDHLDLLHKDYLATESSSISS